MDRLINIKSQDSYPWVVEEIEILEKHGDYINALLDGLRLPGGSCVFVQKHTNQNGYLQESVVYIVEPLHEDGELFFLKGDDTVKVADLLSGEAEKMHIYKDTDDVVVEGSQNQTWDECYTLKTVELSASAGDEYTFYDLNDLLRPAVWTDLTNYMAPHVSKGLAGSSTSCMDLSDDYSNRIRKNGQEVDIDLCYVVSANISSIDPIHHDIRDMNFGLGSDIRQLNCLVIHYTAPTVFTCSVAQCYISNGAINLIGVSASDNSSGTNMSLDKVYVWGRVSLK